MYDSTHVFGMHLFWWLFWILAWGSFFSLLTPVPRRRWNRLRESPNEILLRRLAQGEINEQEFESRKAVIDRSLIGSPVRPLTPVPAAP